jgi:L-lactate dehydrogenase
MPALPLAPDLIGFARSLLVAAGMEEDKAVAVAEVLVEGDLLGHTTHGLALLAPYLGELERGAMTARGEPRVLADFPAAVTWDGARLPGQWLTRRAIDLAMARARVNGSCAVSIRRSHHLGCLAAYLLRATEHGFVVVLTCSDPNVASVAPYGGRRAVFTPNPVAAGWPTAGDPVLLDVSMSITTNALTKRLQGEGRRFPGVWALDAEGAPTDDPAALFSAPPGTLLPTGGVDHGHKGYAGALLVEALTGGLAGHGRADAAEGWGATVLVQVYRPECFGGAEEFRRQMEWIAAACRSNPARPASEAVRLPGEAGLRRRRAQLAAGITLHPSIAPTLLPWAEKLRVPVCAGL